MEFIMKFFSLTDRQERIVKSITKELDSSKRVVGRGTLIMDAKEARNSTAARQLIKHIEKNRPA